MLVLLLALLPATPRGADLPAATAGVVAASADAPRRAPAAWDGPPLPRHGDRFLQRWAAAHMTEYPYVVSREEALSLAASHELVVGGGLTNHVEAMKAANPDMLLFTYVNGVYAQRRQEVDFAPHLYLLDEGGERVQSRGFSNWMMDAADVEWQATRVDECRVKLEATGYDRCYVDMLGFAPLLPGYNTGLPVNPRTGEIWTHDELLSANLEIAAALRTVRPGQLLAGNGLADGGRYFSDEGGGTRSLLAGLDIAHFETFVRTGGAGPADFRSEAAWKQDVDALRDVGLQGRAAMTSTKLWGLANPSDAVVDRWHEYALATFLLGSDGNAFFNFTAAKTWASSTADHPWDRLDVGWPLNDYHRRDGLYQRDFTRARVIVNPTPRPSTTRLGATFTDLRGEIAEDRLTLAPNTARILLTDHNVDASDGAPSPPPLDEADPTVAVLRPADGATLPSDRLLLEGTADDDVQVGGVTIGLQDEATGRWLQPDGRLAGPARIAALLVDHDTATAGVDWSLSLRVPEGTWSVDVEATDTALRTTTSPRRRVSVVLGGPDEVAPSVTTTAPEDGREMTGHPVRLSGTADDDRRLVALEVAVRDEATGAWLDHDGFARPAGPLETLVVEQDTRAASATWHVDVDLHDGDYRVEAAAVDLAGNRSVTSTTFSVVGGRPRDLAAPEVTVASPVGGTEVPAGMVRLRGEATDDVRVAAVTVALRDVDTRRWLRDDGSFGAFSRLEAVVVPDDAGGGGVGWSLDVDLPEGDYGFNVEAIDTAGRVSRKPWTSFGARTFAPPPESGPPVVAVTSPRAGETVDARPTVIRGGADDERGVDAVSVAIRSVETGGWLQPDGGFGPFRRLPATLGPEGSWRFAADLPDGDFGFNVLAVYVDGDATTSSWRRFTAAAGDGEDVVAPLVAIVAPASRATIQRAGVTLRGSADDDRGVAAVSLAVRDVDSGRWLQPDGSFGDYRRLQARLETDGASADWRLWTRLPRGRYGFNVEAVDAAGNTSTRSWRRFSMDP